MVDCILFPFAETSTSLVSLYLCLFFRVRMSLRAKEQKKKKKKGGETTQNPTDDNDSRIFKHTLMEGSCLGMVVGVD